MSSIIDACYDTCTNIIPYLVDNEISKILHRKPINQNFRTSEQPIEFNSETLFTEECNYITSQLDARPADSAHPLRHYEFEQPPDDNFSELLRLFHHDYCKVADSAQTSATDVELFRDYEPSELQKIVHRLLHRVEQLDIITEWKEPQSIPESILKIPTETIPPVSNQQSLSSNAAPAIRVKRKYKRNRAGSRYAQKANEMNNSGIEKAPGKSKSAFHQPQDENKTASKNSANKKLPSIRSNLFKAPVVLDTVDETNSKNVRLNSLDILRAVMAELTKMGISIPVVENAVRVIKASGYIASSKQDDDRNISLGKNAKETSDSTIVSLSAAISGYFPFYLAGELEDAEHRSSRLATAAVASCVSQTKNSRIAFEVAWKETVSTAIKKQKLRWETGTSYMSRLLKLAPLSMASVPKGAGMILNPFSGAMDAKLLSSVPTHQIEPNPCKVYDSRVFEGVFEGLSSEGDPDMERLDIYLRAAKKSVDEKLFAERLNESNSKLNTTYQSCVRTARHILNCGYAPLVVDVSGTEHCSQIVDNIHRSILISDIIKSMMSSHESSELNVSPEDSGPFSTLDDRNSLVTDDVLSPGLSSCGPILVVTRASDVLEWSKVFQLQFQDDIVLPFFGGAEDRASLMAYISPMSMYTSRASCRIVVTNYDSLMAEIAVIKNIRWHVINMDSCLSFMSNSEYCDKFKGILKPVSCRHWIFSCRRLGSPDDNNLPTMYQCLSWLVPNSIWDLFNKRSSFASDVKNTSLFPRDKKEWYSVNERILRIISSLTCVRNRALDDDIRHIVKTAPEVSLNVIKAGLTDVLSSLAWAEWVGFSLVCLKNPSEAASDTVRSIFKFKLVFDDCGFASYSSNYRDSSMDFELSTGAFEAAADFAEFIYNKSKPGPKPGSRIGSRSGQGSKSQNDNVKIENDLSMQNSSEVCSPQGDAESSAMKRNNLAHEDASNNKSKHQEPMSENMQLSRAEHDNQKSTMKIDGVNPAGYIEHNLNSLMRSPEKKAESNVSLGAYSESNRSPTLEQKKILPVAVTYSADLNKNLERNVNEENSCAEMIPSAGSKGVDDLNVPARTSHRMKRSISAVGKEVGNNPSMNPVGEGHVSKKQRVAQQQAEEIYSKEEKSRCVFQRNNRWRASVELGGRSRYLGTFATEDEANFAFHAAALQRSQIQRTIKRSYKRKYRGNNNGFVAPLRNPTELSTDNIIDDVRQMAIPHLNFPIAAYRGPEPGLAAYAMCYGPNGFTAAVTKMPCRFGKLGSSALQLLEKMGFKNSLGLSGLSGEVDIHVGDDLSISRTHAEIFYDSESLVFQIKSLSAAGIYLNGRFIAPDDGPVSLSSRDAIQIGCTIFYFMLPVWKRPLTAQAQSPVQQRCQILSSICLSKRIIEFSADENSRNFIESLSRLNVAREIAVSALNYSLGTATANRKLKKIKENKKTNKKIKIDKPVKIKAPKDKSVSNSKENIPKKKKKMKLSKNNSDLNNVNMKELKISSGVIKTKTSKIESVSNADSKPLKKYKKLKHSKNDLGTNLASDSVQKLGPHTELIKPPRGRPPSNPDRKLPKKQKHIASEIVEMGNSSNVSKSDVEILPAGGNSTVQNLTVTDESRKLRRNSCIDWTRKYFNLPPISWPKFDPKNSKKTKPKKKRKLDAVLSSERKLSANSFIAQLVNVNPNFVFVANEELSEVASDSYNNKAVADGDSITGGMKKKQKKDRIQETGAIDEDGHTTSKGTATKKKKQKTIESNTTSAKKSIVVPIVVENFHDSSVISSMIPIYVSGPITPVPSSTNGSKVDVMSDVHPLVDTEDVNSSDI